MKLSKKMPKAQTKFIVKIVLLIFTISTLLFPQYLSESQRNNLEAQLKRQAGKKTIVVEFYASSNYTAQAYGEYIGTWIARNGYEIKNEDADGVGNFKITLYKPSKEELEQRRIAAEKQAKERAKKQEEEKLAEFDKWPSRGLDYAIDKNDIELLKRYYYLNRKLIVEGFKDANANEVSYYYVYKSRYKAPTSIGHFRIIEALHNNSLTDKFFYDAIKFLEKEENNGILWANVSLFQLKPFLQKYSREGVIYNEEFMSDGSYYYKINHSYVDRLCYIITNFTHPDYFLTDTEGSKIFDFPRSRFENEEDALKIYKALLSRYEEYPEWYDKNIPNYKNLLKASFDKRRK